MLKRLFRSSDTVDVLILGSGAAGLTAAILAHDHGARVLILERSAHVGGTSAVSGGALWVPGNDHMAELGEEDSREDAIGYCKALAMGKTSDALIETFVDTAPMMARYLEERTELKLVPLSTPDYHPEVCGGKLAGRTLEPALFDSTTLGPWRDKLRPPSMFPFPTPLKEVYETYQAFYRPWRIPADLIADRMERGMVALGQALVGPLLKAVLDRGIEIRLGTRARELLVDKGRVVGVKTENQDLRAARGVVLATAGFEWSEETQRRFLTGMITAPNSPPVNEGDGLRMAMQVGAQLANMGEVWNYPSMLVPGESYEGRPLARGIKAERSGPHIIWVNRRGQRFVNESANYNSVGKALFEMDANGPAFRNLPAWAVFDRQYRSRYVVGTTMPDDPDPDWLCKAGSLAELATLTGIDSVGLSETVARWNSFVLRGRDRDFDRGESAFDRFQGDHEAPHPNLGSVVEPPFYALPIHAGALGTKGGPRTDVRAQVVDVAGRGIPGLFAAGNVAASITGPSYFGVGSTLGPAMTWGYLAGQTLGRNRP